MVEYIDENGNVVDDGLPPMPAGVEQLAPTLEPVKPKPDSDLDDLFEVPQEHDSDMETGDLFDLPDEDVGVDDEEDLSDLFELNGDIGSPHHPTPKQRPILRRVIRPRYAPPTSMGRSG